MAPKFKAYLYFMINKVFAGISEWTIGSIESWSQSHLSRKHLPLTPKLMGFDFLHHASLYKHATLVQFTYLFIFNLNNLKEINSKEFSSHQSSPLFCFLFSSLSSSLLDESLEMTLLPTDTKYRLYINYMLCTLYTFMPRALCK